MSLSFTSTSFSNALPLIDSMSALFNPYQLMAKTINDRKKGFATTHIFALALALMITHFILGIQAILSLGLKIFGKKKKPFWLWRKHYPVNRELPYFVPNGYLLNELLQLMGCIFTAFFALVLTYIVCKSDVEATSSALHPSSMFWLGAVSLTPGFIGLWLSGWSAIYVVILTPSRTDSKISKDSFIQNPLLMNAICIGIPILVSSFFFLIGVALSIKYQEMLDSFNGLMKKLEQFSATWEAGDSQNHQKNLSLFKTVEKMMLGAHSLSTLCQLMAFGWAIVSLMIIMFYMATTLALGKLLKGALKPLDVRCSIHDDESKDSQVGTCDAFVKNTEKNKSKTSIGSGASGAQLNNQIFANRLRRNYYFILTSCGIIIMALGFNFTSSMLLGLKAKVLVLETHWQVRIFALFATASWLLSLSLVLQSLLLVSD